jgi:hypothetical protein
VLAKLAQLCASDSEAVAQRAALVVGLLSESRLALVKLPKVGAIGALVQVRTVVRPLWRCS